VKRNKIAAGELTELSYRDYYRSCKRLIVHFGADRRVDDLRPVEFELFRAKLATRLAVTALLQEVNRCRVLFKYVSDQHLMLRPVHFSQSFDRPSKKVQRKARNEAGTRKFTRGKLLMILDALDGRPVRVTAEEMALTPDRQLKAMALLGLNVALGITDCANLRDSHLTLRIT